MPNNYDKPQVLIPLGPSTDRAAHPGPNQPNIHYISPEKFLAQFNVEYDDAEHKRAILILNERTGTYLTKEQTRVQTYGGPGVAKDDPLRTRLFEENMTRLGLSSTIYATPKGPDLPVLINRGDGRFEAIDPKVKGLTSLNEAAQRYGGEDKIMMQGKGDDAKSYKDIAGSINRSDKTQYAAGTPAENLFAYHANTAPPRPSGRGETEVFVQVNKEIFVSPTKYYEMAQSDRSLPTDTSKLSVLIATQNNGLQTPRVAVFSKNLSQGGVEEILRRNGIQDPEKVNSFEGVKKPPVLVRVGDGLVSVELVQQKNPNKALNSIYHNYEIYVQNTGKRGPTGQFVDQAKAEEKMSEKQKQEFRIEKGITPIPPEAERARVNVDDFVRSYQNLKITAQQTGAERETPGAAASRPLANVVENDDYSIESDRLAARRPANDDDHSIAMSEGTGADRAADNGQLIDAHDDGASLSSLDTSVRDAERNHLGRDY